MRDLAPKLRASIPGYRRPKSRPSIGVLRHPSLPVLVAAVPSDLSNDGLLDSAWMLFAIVAALLVLFVLVIAILAMMRAIRRRRPPSASPKPPAPVDPWTEAGRRARPYADYRRKDDNS